MYAQQMNIDNISNNLANINTTGYKKSRVQFQDLMYQTIKEAGSATSENTQRPVELSVGVGVKSVATQRSFTVGTPTNTNNPLDIAITGDGFFQLVDGNGDIVYSRDGSFKMDGDGVIVNAQGLKLEPEITIPADAEAISISSDGIVTVRLYGSSDSEEVGQIDMARFVNPAGLRSVGGNTYEMTDASGEAIIGTPSTETFGALEQGWVESSNVVIVEEMVNMIMAQRAYDLNSKAVTTSDKLIETANNLKR